MQKNQERDVWQFVEHQQLNCFQLLNGSEILQLRARIYIGVINFF